MSGQLPFPQFSSVSAAKIVIPSSEPEREECRQEYEIIRTAFLKLLFHAENEAQSLELLEDVVSLRASFLIDRALRGLNLDLDRALVLLSNHNDFTTERERQERDILVAGIDNLIDFALAEEYTLLNELPDELNDTDFERCESVCERYNYVYAIEENSTVFFAAKIAAWWLLIDGETVVTFMTQQDERVRPLHEALEGLSYSKSKFPVELIPPIEWGCRCYLSADGLGIVSDYLVEKGKQRDADFNPVFSEKLATGGRIFSDSHSYFLNKLPRDVIEIGEHIKTKFGLPCQK